MSKNTLKNIAVCSLCGMGMLRKNAEGHARLRRKSCLLLRSRQEMRARGYVTLGETRLKMAQEAGVHLYFAPASPGIAQGHIHPRYLELQMRKRDRKFANLRLVKHRDEPIYKHWCRDWVCDFLDASEVTRTKRKTWPLPRIRRVQVLAVLVGDSELSGAFTALLRMGGVKSAMPWLWSELEIDGRNACNDSESTLQ